jgi:hypothetical protein
MVTPTVTVAFRRIYMDISGEVDAKLEALAAIRGKAKKQLVQDLINQAVADYDDDQARQGGGKKKK